MVGQRPRASELLLLLTGLLATWHFGDGDGRRSFVPGVGSAALVRQRSPRRAFGTGKDYEVGAELSASQIRFMELAKEFVETGTGFGSPARPELIADDFVFRGPIIGPLCKADYLETLNTNKVYEAFPDLASGAFGYTVDPKEPNRIWFFTRFTGTNTGPIRLGNFVELPPTGAEINGAPEVNSIMLDEHGRVKLFTVGYNVDRDAGTSGGAGALFGLLNGCGIPMPPGWLFSVGQWFGNLAADVFNNFAGSRTVSREEDLPAWYKSYCPTRRGSEGVY